MAIAPKKTSALTTKTSLAPTDYILGVSDPSGVPTTCKILNQNFFATVATPMTVSANVTITGNSSVFIAPTVKSANLHSTDSSTPVSSSDAVEKGKIWFDTNYLYVAVANNTIKRVALTSF